MALRIVQWTTGNVGKQTVAAIAANPALELVGCYAWSPEKVGRDAGELCGLGPLGVVASDDVGALRVRTVATKDRACADFPYKGEDGKYLPEVVLDFDYTVLMPRR